MTFHQCQIPWADIHQPLLSFLYIDQQNLWLRHQDHC